MSREDAPGGFLGNAVRKRKFEVLGEKLFDVWSSDICRLHDLDNFEDLERLC